MITFARERARELKAEIMPLLDEHWREIATYADIPLDPDFDSYNKADDLGILRCFTARSSADGDLTAPLVGYCVFMVGNLHYKSSKIATQDVLFLLPAHRRGSTGVRLISYCEMQLKDEGIQVIYQHQKLTHPALGIILGRSGYQKIETLWAKRFS